MSKNNSFRNKDAANNPLLLFFISICFIGFSIALFFLTKNEEENKQLLKIITYALGAIGVLILFYAVYRLILLQNLKKLRNDDNAYITKAAFVKSSYSSATGDSMGMLGIPTNASAYVYKKITYAYTDERNVRRTVKSVISYTPN